MLIELGNVNIRFDPKVIELLLKFIQNDDTKPEAGGILIGYYIDDYSFFITDLSIPNQNDLGTRFSFLRSFKNAQNIIKSFFKGSNGKKIYLGEWHTHPEKYPVPSETDLKSFNSLLKENKLNSNFIFMLIMGTDEFYIAINGKEGLINQTKLKYKINNGLLTVI